MTIIEGMTLCGLLSMIAVPALILLNMPPPWLRRHFGRNRRTIVSMQIAEVSFSQDYEEDGYPASAELTVLVWERNWFGWWKKPILRKIPTHVRFGPWVRAQIKNTECFLSMCGAPHHKNSTPPQRLIPNRWWLAWRLYRYLKTGRNTVEESDPYGVGK